MFPAANATYTFWSSHTSVYASDPSLVRYPRKFKYSGTLPYLSAIAFIAACAGGTPTSSAGASC